jgi:hypothetical protein
MVEVVEISQNHFENTIRINIKSHSLVLHPTIRSGLTLEVKIHFWGEKNKSGF